MMSIGVQVTSLQMPLKKALPVIAKLGVQGIEIDARGELKPSEMSQSGLRQIRKMLDDFGLHVGAVSFQTRRGYDVADDLQRRIDATKQALSFAYLLGCSCVLNQVGQIPSAEENPEGRQRLIDSLTDIGRHSQRAGAWLAITTGTEDGTTMRDLLADLPEGSVRVNFDPGLLIVNSFSPREAIEQLAPYVAHVQARDGVRDLARRRGLETPLGRGTADFPYLLGTLIEYNYQGFWTIARERSERPVEEIAMAVEYLKNIQ